MVSGSIGNNNKNKKKISREFYRDKGNNKHMYFLHKHILEFIHTTWFMGYILTPTKRGRIEAMGNILPRIRIIGLTLLIETNPIITKLKL